MIPRHSIQPYFPPIIRFFIGIIITAYYVLFKFSKYVDIRIEGPEESFVNENGKIEI